jgi:hypothetical protein
MATDSRKPEASVITGLNAKSLDILKLRKQKTNKTIFFLKLYLLSLEILLIKIIAKPTNRKLIN